MTWREPFTCQQPAATSAAAQDPFAVSHAKMEASWGSNAQVRKANVSTYHLQTIWRSTTIPTSHNIATMFAHKQFLPFFPCSQQSTNPALQNHSKRRTLFPSTLKRHLLPASTTWGRLQGFSPRSHRASKKEEGDGGPVPSRL